MTTATDRIEKTAVYKAPLARVWAAISEAEQFGRWFGMALEGPFVAGQRVRGRIVPTTVDPDVARMQEPHAGTPFVLFVERIEPMHLLAFRWHHGSPGEDGGGGQDEAPTTLVEFRLEAVTDGTRVTIVESGFDAIPLERRAQAMADNSDGWAHQLRLIGLYLERAA